jgi:hypothetical protein
MGLYGGNPGTARVRLPIGEWLESAAWEYSHRRSTASSSQRGDAMVE